MGNRINKIRLSAMLLLTALLFLCGAAEAHFSLILPSDAIITRGESRDLTLDIMQLHPHEYSVFPMEEPHALILWHEGQEIDLSDALTNTPEGTGNIWSTTYKVTKPGDYIIYMEPAPLFEPSDDLMIVQYAKVVVNVMGRAGDWKRPVGAKAEIVPLTRPYGVWAGSVFQGRVLIDNSPVPNMDVIVEHLNDPMEGHILKATADESTYTEQVVRTDERGIFTASMPAPGWWGFKAVSPPLFKLEYEGRQRNVSVGAVIWVYAEEVR